HRGTDYRLEAGNSEPPGQYTILAIHHVAHRESREAHARLLFAVRWRSREAITDRIGRDDEVTRGIQCLPRPDQKIQPMVVTREGDTDQHDIRFVPIEFAVGDVGLAIVSDDFARLQFKIAK